MTDNTSTAKGIENRFFGLGEIDEYLGELGREHADFGVAFGSRKIPAGIGGNILSADTDGDEFLGVEKFDFIGGEAEFVVVGGGAAESGGGLIGYDADGIARATEDIFEL